LKNDNETPSSCGHEFQIARTRETRSRLARASPMAMAQTASMAKARRFRVETGMSVRPHAIDPQLARRGINTSWRMA
jgi:hypothetical protein